MAAQKRDREAIERYDRVRAEYAKVTEPDRHDRGHYPEGGTAGAEGLRTPEERQAEKAAGDVDARRLREQRARLFEPHWPAREGEAPHREHDIYPALRR